MDLTGRIRANDWQAESTEELLLNLKAVSVMKRPALFYFVTGWLCLGLLLQLSVIGRWANYYRESGQPTSPYLGAVALLGLAGAIWLVWGLVRLRLVARWLAVGFFVSWVIFGSWGMARVLLSADTPPPSNMRVVALFVVLWLAIFFPSIASIVYLSRKQFREFAIKFVEEDKREKKRAFAEKQMKKGFKS